MTETIARLLFPYESVRRVLWGPLRGYKYIVQPGMGLTYAFGKGVGNAFLTERIAPGSTVFDVGANRGQFALFFGEMVGEEGQVVSFEPVEELADLVRRNAELNNLSNIDVITAAAAEGAGTAEFEYSEARSTQGMLGDTEPKYTLSNAQCIEVRTVSLDDIAGEMGLWPDVIKIDVEGGARVVFEGAQRILNRGPNIYIELHGPEEQRAVRDELVARRYSVRTLDGIVVRDPTDEWHSPLWCVKQ